MMANESKMLPLLLDQPVTAWDLPPDQPYREKQIRTWVLQRFVSSYDEMTDLSLPLRTSLAARFRLRAAEPVTIHLASAGFYRAAIDYRGSFPFRKTIVSQTLGNKN